MRAASAALKAHLAGSVLTVCTLWKVTRRDNTVFGFTDHDQPIPYLGTTYEAAAGHTASSIKTTAQLNVDNLDVMGMLSSDTLTDASLQAGLWNFAIVEIMVVNYMDLTMGHMMLRKGTIGNVRTGRHNFIAELRGMTQSLQQVIGRVFAAACDADLGDARCGVILGNFTVTGNVTSTTSAHVFTDTARTENAAYFEGGLVTWTSGLNATYSMEVKSFANGVVTLQQYMPNAIAIGDAYSMSAGCDKLRTTCRDKFNNIVNIRGFPDVPGTDKMLSGA